MKIFILISIFNLVTGCSGTDKSNDSGKIVPVISSNDTVSIIDDSLQNELSGKEITMTVSYAAIECGCPQWFETKFKDVKYLEGIERFYLEPSRKSLTNANGLWDGEHLPITLKVTGRFSKEKELPVTYRTKGEPEKARIFWYDKITVISPSAK